MNSDAARTAAIAQLDQVETEMSGVLDIIVAQVREDVLSNEIDRAKIYARLVVSIVNEYGMPKQGPGAYVFATALLRLAEKGS